MEALTNIPEWSTHTGSAVAGALLMLVLWLVQRLVASKTDRINALLTRLDAVEARYEALNTKYLDCLTKMADQQKEIAELRLMVRTYQQTG